MSTAEQPEFVSVEDYLAAEELARDQERVHRRLGSRHVRGHQSPQSRDDELPVVSGESAGSMANGAVRIIPTPKFAFARRKRGDSTIRTCKSCVTAIRPRTSFRIRPC